MKRRGFIVTLLNVLGVSGFARAQALPTKRLEPIVQTQLRNIRTAFKEASGRFPREYLLGGWSYNRYYAELMANERIGPVSTGIKPSDHLWFGVAPVILAPDLGPGQVVAR